LEKPKLDQYIQPVASASGQNDHCDFSGPFALRECYNAKPQFAALPPGYLPNRSHNRLPDCPCLPTDRKSGVDGIESLDFDQNNLTFQY